MGVSGPSWIVSPLRTWLTMDMHYRCSEPSIMGRSELPILSLLDCIT